MTQNLKKIQREKGTRGSTGKKVFTFALPEKRIFRGDGTENVRKKGGGKGRYLDRKGKITNVTS